MFRGLCFGVTAVLLLGNLVFGAPPEARLMERENLKAALETKGL